MTGYLLDEIYGLIDELSRDNHMLRKELRPQTVRKMKLRAKELLKCIEKYLKVITE
jgi:hypothetical protein